MSCGVGRRCDLDLVLQWLWRRPASLAPVRPLAWDPPYAVSAALKKTKKKKRRSKCFAYKQMLNAYTPNLKILFKDNVQLDEFQMTYE